MSVLAHCPWCGGAHESSATMMGAPVYACPKHVGPPTLLSTELWSSVSAPHPQLVLRPDGAVVDAQTCDACICRDYTGRCWEHGRLPSGGAYEHQDTPLVADATPRENGLWSPAAAPLVAGLLSARGGR